MASYYSRINPTLGLVEQVSMRSGRLYRVLLISDTEDAPVTQMHARIGFIFYSKSIPELQLSYYKTIDTAMFLPCEPFVKREICSQVSEGTSVTALCKKYVGRLPFPPFEVISVWAGADKDFASELIKARRQAARVRFDQALQIALDNKEDVKVLKTLVDVLERHAQIDDPEVFAIKPEAHAASAPVSITIVTGVPQPESRVIEVEKLEQD